MTIFHCPKCHKIYKCDIDESFFTFRKSKICYNCDANNDKLKKSCRSKKRNVDKAEREGKLDRFVSYYRNLVKNEEPLCPLNS